MEKAKQLLEGVRRDEIDRVVEEQGKIGYLITKPRDGKRRIIVYRRKDGGTLKKPVEVEVPADLRDEDLYLVDYIIQSVCMSTPACLSFALENKTVLNMAKYYLLYRTGSRKTLWNRIYHLYKFSKYLGKTPDQLIHEASIDSSSSEWLRQRLEDYLLALKSRGASPSYLILCIEAVKALYKTNGLEFKFDKPLKNITVYQDRTPRPEELQKLLEVANLREKVIVSMLALGGFRLSTLVRLKYRHVKHDLERGITPIHIHVESEITKGKYGDYDTFIGSEAVEFLKLYLEERRRRGEVISDESPLIATEHRPPRPLTEVSVYSLINRLYAKAGLIRIGEGKRHEVRVHSLRKYFRTWLASRGVPAEYIEYMMGHRTSRYNDIKSLGIEYLRELYRLADLSIRPKPLTEDQIIRVMHRALRTIAERAGIRLDGELYPAAYISGEGGSGEFDKLSMELETILRHVVAKLLEAEGGSKNKLMHF